MRKKNLFKTMIIAACLPVIAVSCNNGINDKPKPGEAAQIAADTLNMRNSELEKAKAIEENAEWLEFKAEAEKKIAANEVKVAELRIDSNKQGKSLDKMRLEKIVKLEKNNQDIRIKLANYKHEKSNWESFKEEFNHDMGEIGKALNDVTIDNKK
jgi:hypothetical protein